MKDFEELAQYMLAVADEVDTLSSALLGALELFNVKNSLIGHNDDDSRATKIRCDTGIEGIVSVVKWYCDTLAQCIEPEAREALETLSED